ncbi:MAG: glycosyltransferase family 39 protein [Planctomycetota bacterium]|nr:glycosyltransferase family 39 protein [Planctomycetota bacterium]
MRGLFDRWTLSTLVIVGVFMFWAAGRYTVFDDEANSCRRYVLPVGEMVSALWKGVEPDPPLYYLLQNRWVRLFGVGPLGLRSMSILFFLAGVVTVRAAAESWFDAPTGRSAMLIAALHPAHLFFGFAGRWYAMMFCLVAALLFVTGRLYRGRGGRRSGMIAWTAIATAVCYTNYFGPVVVGLVWLVAIADAVRTKRMWRGWVIAAAAVIALYSPWGPPFVFELTRFPEVGGSWFAYVATAGRTGLALLTGNLASVRALWAWAPMSVFAIAAGALLVRHWRTVWPIAVIVVGCLVAGIASLSMKDKYIMTFTAPVCILAAALLVFGLRKNAGRGNKSITRVATAALIVGWAGCAVNLVTQNHWSSLRWLDPFEEATREVHRTLASDPDLVLVVTHPSAWYYLGCLGAIEQGVDGRQGWRRIPAERWRRAEQSGPGPLPITNVQACKPQDILPAVRDGSAVVERWVTIETAEYAGDPAWSEFRQHLEAAFESVAVKSYLEDADAALKDRLDPRFKHPRKRIVVRHWVRHHVFDK